MSEQITESPISENDQSTPVAAETVAADSRPASTTDAAAENTASEAAVEVKESPLQKRQQNWSALPFENVQLIRLAPLTAERETGLRPLLFGCLSRVSRHSKEFSMLRMSINLPEQKNNRTTNYLEIRVDHREKEIHLQPEDGLVTSPGNRGLGRLMLAQAVAWCSPKWHDYSLPTIDLKTQQVANELARLRRDHALQAQGFTVTYNDAVQMSARCNAMRLEQLGQDWNREKVRIMDHLEAAHLLYSSDLNLKAQTSQINKLNERIELLQRDDNTLRFTIFTLVFFAIFQAGLLIWMATR